MNEVMTTHQTSASNKFRLLDSSQLCVRDHKRQHCNFLSTVPAWDREYEGAFRRFIGLEERLYVPENVIPSLAT